MIQERYRKDYDGEFVVVNTIYKNGKKQQQREWVPNPIDNQHISGRAVVIGSGSTRERFHIKRLENHRGGLLGSKRLQTYGAENSWTDLKLHFFVSNNTTQLEEIIKHNYQESTIVYTDTKNCIANPGEFYLIPYNISLHSTAQAMYIAAFDGHSEVFCVGVDATDASGTVNDKIVSQITSVMNTYRDVIFTFVSINKSQPGAFRECANFRYMTYPEFVSYCDV